MTETIANILSIAFNYLNNEKLEGKEVKNFTASNIMLNLQSIFSKTIEALNGSRSLKSLVDLA